MNNNQMNNKNSNNINNRSTTPNQRGSAPKDVTPSNFNNVSNVPYNGGFNPEFNTPNDVQIGSNLNNQSVEKPNPIPNRPKETSTIAPKGARRNIPTFNKGNLPNRLNKMPKGEPSGLKRNNDNVPSPLKNKNNHRGLNRFLGGLGGHDDSEKEPVDDVDSNNENIETPEEPESNLDEAVSAVEGVRKAIFWVKALPIIGVVAAALLIIILVLSVISEPTIIISPFLAFNSSTTDNPVYVSTTPEKKQEEKAYYEKVLAVMNDYSSEYGVTLDKYLLNGTLLYRFYIASNNFEDEDKIDFNLASSNIIEVARLMTEENGSSYTTDFKENGAFYNSLMNSEFLTNYYKEALAADNSSNNREKLVKRIFEFAETARGLIETKTNAAFLGDSMRMHLQTCQYPYSTTFNERGKKVFSNSRNINAGTQYPEYFSMSDYLKGAVEGEIGRGSLNEAEREGVKAFTVATLTYMLHSFFVDFYPGVQDINFPTGNCRLVSCDVKNGCSYTTNGNTYGTAYSGTNRGGGIHRPWNEAQNKFMDDVLAEIYGVVMVQKGVTAENFSSGTQLTGGNYYDKKSNPNCGNNCMGQEDALADSRNGMTYEQILHKYYNNFDLINIREGLYYETTNNYNGQVNLNENYHYYQTDYKGTNSFCEGGTISARGCSVSSTAIVVSLLTNQRITPQDISNKLKSTGKCNGNRPTYAISAAKEYGLSAYSVNKGDTTAINKMLSDLASGHSAVVARIAANDGQGARYSTSAGHYIALVGVKTEGGRTKVLVWDPATRSSSRDNYWADFGIDIAPWVNNPAFMVLSNN